MSEAAPEVTIEDPAALLKAHEKAKADLVALREQLTTLEKRLDEVKAEKESLEEAKKSFLEATKTTEALKALEAEGVKDADRILKYMKLDEVTVGDDGKVEGLDNALKTVKEDFKELFDVKRRAGKADIHPKPPVEEKPKTGTEAQIARMFNR